MDLETTQKITNLQRRLDAQELPERPTDLVSSFMALTGLRGFWPMSAFEGAGSAGTIDQSGHGLTLTFNGNGTYNYDGLVPYIDLDGTGDYLSRADNVLLDILGTEAFVASAVRGLTFGGWFWFDTVGINLFDGIMCKGSGASANQAYNLILGDASGQFFLQCDGGGVTKFAFGPTAVASTWHFIVGRFTPSIEVAINSNGIWARNTTAIMASLNNSAAALEIGRRDLSNSFVLDGRASLCFLCAAALSDTIIDAAFQATRAAFGV